MEKKIIQNTTYSGLRIVLFGPESSGKTTLAQQLAAHYKAAFVPEFARGYLEQKIQEGQGNCTFDDILPIANGQLAIENAATEDHPPMLFCDTNPILTAAYSAFHYGRIPEELENTANELHYDFYLVTIPDMPAEADTIRQHAAQRDDEYRSFKRVLKKRHLPYAKVRGSASERFETAIQHINNLQVILENGFKTADYLWVLKQKLDIPTLLKHIAIVNNKILPQKLAHAATPSDGILLLNKTEQNELVELFDSEKTKLSMAKFVPASGAASRMFKFLLDFIENYVPDQESINAYINHNNAKDLSVFLVGLEKFPFYELVIAELKRNYSNFDQWNKDLKDFFFIKFMLSQRHFNFAAKPKGLLPFHKNSERVSTATEAHLREALNYAISGDEAVLHFTISAEFQPDFETIVDDYLKRENQNVRVSYSVQASSTNTIAVGENGLPHHDKFNHLICRPSGHGALLQNLNQIQADIIFIKNIDNVSLKSLNEITFYKKMLAGKLIQIQKKVFEILNDLEANNDMKLDQALDFSTKNLNIKLPTNLENADFQETKEWLFKKLNRPIRVCGMVKNEGEPGGGPFWTLDKDQQPSLQIVESAQIDLGDPAQKAIFDASTHFNPVDLVCAVKDFKGNAFNLHDFVDADSGFIVEKSKDGKSFKAYELPGLWNGSMANWLTIFVEVPLQTFNPVKTVNDLLKPAHQP